MGKASKKKKQQESQAESILNGTSLISSDISSKSSLFNKPIVHFFLIAIVGFLVYSNTFNIPFHFDDPATIVENSELRDLSNFWPPSDSRWFGFLTFALNYHFGGLNTTSYHIVNLAIHIFNAILVYWLVALTLRTPYFMVRQSHYDATVTRSHEPVGYPFTYLPLFIALLFVSHPIQTQAVTYIVQRFTSLAAFFYLLSLIMYIKFRSQQSDRSGQQKLPSARYTLYAVSLISAILAMKTKEIAFTLPIIIVLYEFMFFDGKIKKRILYLLPLLLTMLIIPLSIIGIDKPIGDVIGELREVSQETEEIPRWSYLFTQFRVIVTYIRLLFLPINQNLDYDYTVYHSFFNPEVFLSFLFLLLIFGLGIYLFYSKRYKLYATRLTAFGIFWFFITLSVESSIIPIRDVIFEHRMYLPSIGLFFAILTFTFLLAEKLKSRWQKVNRAVVVTLAIVIAVLSITTYARNIIWHDWVSLWEDVVRKSPQKARGYNNLGVAFKNNALIDKAIEYFQISLGLNPGYAIAHYNLGVAYQDRGWLSKAADHYQVALSLKPDYAEVYSNLGAVCDAKGLTDKAIEYYQMALNLKPGYAEAYNNLGFSYMHKGMTDKAIEHYQAALKFKPDFAEAYNNLGYAYFYKGLTEKAIEYYQVALSLKPDYAEVYSNLGAVYDAKGLTDKAIEHCQTALSLEPDCAEAYNNLGASYMHKGMTDKAIDSYRKALDIKADYADAHFNLGLVYLAGGTFNLAGKEFETVLQINPNYPKARQFLDYISSQNKHHPSR